MKNTKIFAESLINQDAKGLLCSLILQNTILPPYRRRSLITKQQQFAKEKSEKEIKKQICAIFFDFKKIVGNYIQDDITAQSLLSIPFVERETKWSPVFQNINAMPSLVDISPLLSSLCAKDCAKQIRELYIGRTASHIFYTFFKIFAIETKLNSFVESEIITSVLYRSEVSLLTRTTLYFLCDLWICSQQSLSFTIKHTYKHVSKSGA